MQQFTSSRPHIAKLQRYERRRAKLLKGFDTLLNILTIATLIIFSYIVLVGALV